MISLVIITLNEGKNIANLLNSLILQSYKNYEVILVDSDSKDDTKKIVMKYKKKLPKLSFYTMKKRGVCLARNYGAEKAKGEFIFFMDADIILDKDFLKDSVAEMKRKKLDCAGVYMKSMNKNPFDHIPYLFLNFWFFIMQKTYPHCVGSCLISTKKVHRMINGFDTDIKLAEDNDYVNRANKEFKYNMIKQNVKVSPRRFEAEGRFKLIIKYLLVFFHRVFLGEIKTNVFHYKFGHYNERKKK